MKCVVQMKDIYRAIKNIKHMKTSLQKNTFKVAKKQK